MSNANITPLFSVEMFLILIEGIKSDHERNVQQTILTIPACICGDADCAVPKKSVTLTFRYGAFAPLLDRVRIQCGDAEQGFQTLDAFLKSYAEAYEREGKARIVEQPQAQALDAFFDALLAPWMKH